MHWRLKIFSAWVFKITYIQNKIFLRSKFVISLSYLDAKMYEVIYYEFYNKIKICRAIFKAPASVTNSEQYKRYFILSSAVVNINLYNKIVIS